MSSTYGLVVDTTGLPTLPNNVNEADSKSGIGASSYDPPIHVLSLPQFSKLHLQHILTHPPDSVLFPFLHGLEGENEAQNTFFISSTHSGTTTPRKPTYGVAPGNHAFAGADANGIPHSLHHYLAQKEKVKIKPLPPKYRGLVWVVCEEDLDKPLPVPGSPLPPPTSSPVPSSPAQSFGSSPRSPGRAAARKPALAPHARHYIRELAVLRRKKEGGFGDAAFAPPHVPPEALPYPHIGGFVQEPHSAMYTSMGEDTSDSDFDYDDDDSSYDEEDYEDDDVEDDAEITLDTPTSASLVVTDMAAAAKSGGQDPHPHQPMDDAVRVVDQDSLNNNNRQDEQVIAMDIDVDVDMSNNPPPTTIFNRESGAPSPSPPSSQDGEGEDKEVDKNEAVHMHPVVQRPGLQHRDHTVTPATLNSVMTPSDTFSSSATAVENGHAEPASPNSVNEKEVKHKKSRSNSLPPSISQDPRIRDPTLSLFTSTFRPCEIIRRVPGSTYKNGEDGEWEFMPLKVPDGISLRNFGIQVPIYSTICDIVVYSPHGPSSPNAQRLARRLRQAIRRKWEERAERAKAMGWSDEALGLRPSTSKQKPEEGQEYQPKEDVLLKYNVFLLDADDDSMRGYSLYSPTPSVSTTASPQPPAHVPDVAKQVMEAAAYTSTSPSFGSVNYPGLAHIMVRVCGGSSGAPITFSGSPPIPGSNSDSSSRSGSTVANVPIIDTSPSATTSNVALSASPSSMSPAPSGTALTGPGAPGDMEMNVLTALEEKGPAAVNVGGAHTDRSDGHLVEMRDEERMEVDKEVGGREDTSMEVDVEHRAINVSAEDGSKLSLASISDLKQEKRKRRSHSPNTVDFAQREKEEMRDLTKASEIIGLMGTEWEPSLVSSGPPPPVPGFSIPEIVKRNLEGEVVKVDTMNEKEKAEQREKARQHRSLSPTSWDSKVGQIFLGNAEDVPLLPELPPDPRMNSPPQGSNYPGSPGSSPSSARNPAGSAGTGLSFDDPFLYTPSNDPRRGMGFDICIECHDLAPFPSMAHMRAAEEHLSALDVMWAERCAAAVTNPSFREELSRAFGESDQAAAASGQAHSSGRVRNVAIPIPARPPPNANAVIHLPMPSSPPNTQATIAQLMPLIKFLERWIKPMEGDDKPRIHVSVTSPASSPSPSPPSASSDDGKQRAAETPAPRRWSSMMSAFPSLPGMSNPTPHIQRNRSFTSPTPTTPPPTYQPTPSFYPPNPRSRPLKILLYSADGYTESSVPALSMLMAMKRLLLPEAYLELQVEKKRSFFVYQADLGLLKRVELRLREERDREAREKERVAMEKALLNGNGKRVAEGSLSPIESHRQPRNSINDSPTAGQPRRMAAKSVSFAQPPTIPPPVPPTRTPTGNPAPGGQGATTTTQPGRSPPMTVPSTSSLPPSEPNVGPGAPGASSYSAPTSASPTPTEAQPSTPAVKGRPRAMTSPWLPSLFGGDHQSWFNDPRFDGSFPSRVLPFLYLGNLNHAANAYMLHALGITHVVSVGECALVPPAGYGSGYTHPSYVGPTSSSPYHRPGPGAHYVPGKGPGQGSLWLEEREGRIKVLDIKGVCDDGIDTLEPQLEPICDWIDQARIEGGQVLVHCRVGVSRSATVTIAYVMKHLGLSLVDAYLIVRSRRLSVLIQPNMRLLYNLCGWEIKLAKERAGDDENKLKRELARTLSWPYLAKEVHALNEKYLH